MSSLIISLLLEVTNLSSFRYQENIDKAYSIFCENNYEELLYDNLIPIVKHKKIIGKIKRIFLNKVLHNEQLKTKFYNRVLDKHDDNFIINHVYVLDEDIVNYIPDKRIKKLLNNEYLFKRRFICFDIAEKIKDRLLFIELMEKILKNYLHYDYNEEFILKYKKCSRYLLSRKIISFYSFQLCQIITKIDFDYFKFIVDHLKDGLDRCTVISFLSGSSNYEPNENHGKIFSYLMKSFNETYALSRIFENKKFKNKYILDQIHTTEFENTDGLISLMRKDVNYFIFDYYYKKCSNINIKKLVIESVISLADIYFAYLTIDVQTDLFSFHEELLEKARTYGNYKIIKYLKQFGIVSDMKEPIFYLPYYNDERDQFINEKTLELFTIKDDIDIIIYRNLTPDNNGNPEQLPMILDQEEIKLWFSKDKDGNFIWRAPTTKKLKFGIPLIKDARVLKNLSSICNDEISSYIENNLIYFCDSSDYKIEIKEIFGTLEEDEKKVIKEILIKIFHLGMTMRRWKENQPYPLSFSQDDSRKILFSDNTSLTRIQAENHGMLLTVKQTNEIYSPLKISELIELIDKLDITSKNFFNNLREYDISSCIEYTGSKIYQTLQRVQEDDNNLRCCIQLQNQMFIVTSYINYEILFEEKIDNNFDITKFRYMHYDNS